MLPPPPWSFKARVLYQPTFIPVEAARAATPTSGLTLLSLFGWTLGGVFAVEWTDSPIGPYREVAVLSGLVARGLDIGAWASHIVVTTPEAVDSGREFFGLPTVLGSIDFESAAGPDGFTFSTRTDVAINGWDDWLPPVIDAGFDADGWRDANTVDGSPNDALTNDPMAIALRQASGLLKLPSLSVSLPSFSGALPAPSGQPATPLLRYPLRLGPARRVRLRDSMPTRVESDGVEESLRAVLSGRPACPCVQIDGVDVVAGKPFEI